MLGDYKKLLNKKPIIILLHVTAWVLFIFFPFLFYRVRIVDNWFYYKQIIDSLFLIGFFYLNIYVLIPKLFNSKGLALYLSVALLFISILALQRILTEYLFSHIQRDQLLIAAPFGDAFPARPLGPAPERIFFLSEDTVLSHNPDHDGPRIYTKTIIGKPFKADFIFLMIRKSMLPSFFILFLSGFIKIADELLKAEKQKKELANQRLNAELAFLKAQINPHFFFNTLNSIYSLAHKKSDHTEEAILKLSDIMRYVIYESNEEKVLLSKEIKYLNDYIDLQRLRLSKNIEIQFNVAGNANNLQIAPMLLIPFIENAFKHGISYLEKTYIHIDLAITEDNIDFSVRNKILKRKDQNENESGVGLENTRKRLDLLYPEKYSLAILENNHDFNVKLSIQLDYD